MFLCKALVLFTAGAQTQRSRNPREEQRINPADNAKKLKEKNVTVITVAAGTADPVELQGIATGPRNVIVVSLENLDRAVDRITAQICRIEITVRKLLLFIKGVY